MLIVRRSAPEGSYFEDGDRASGVFVCLQLDSLCYSASWCSLRLKASTRRERAPVEAAIVAQQFETAQLLPVAVRARLSGQLVGYARIGGRPRMAEDGGR